MIIRRMANSRNSKLSELTLLIIFSKIISSGFCNEVETCQDKDTVSLKILKAGQRDAIALNDPYLILSENDLPVQIKCISKSPVEWNFFGLTKEVPLKTERYKEFLNVHWDPLTNTIITDGCYISQLKIITVSKHNIGRYSCQSTDSSASFNLFFSGKDRPYYLNEGSKVQVRPRRHDSEIILPCPVSLPHDDFQVLHYGGWKPEKVDIKLDPTKGFVIEILSDSLQNLFAYVGDYQCVREGDGDIAESHSVSVEIVSPIDYYLQPDVDEIKTRSGFTVKCSCTSEITLDTDGDIKRVDITYSFHPNSLYKFMAILEYPEVPPGESGSISCRRANKQIIQTWKYKRVDFEGGLNLHLQSSNLICRAETDTELDLNLAFCKYPNGCAFSTKDLLIQDETSSVSVSPFKIESCGEGCNQIKTDKFGGVLVNCTTHEISTVRLFFIGLDHKFYWKLEEAPIEAIVRITEYTTSGNAGAEVLANCEWVPFYLSESVLWTLDLLNGSSMQLEPDIHDFFETENGSQASKVHLSSLPFSAKRLNCFVPAWDNVNSWMQSSVDLIVDDPMEPPSFMKDSDESIKENSTRDVLKELLVNFEHLYEENNFSDYYYYNQAVACFLICLLVILILLPMWMTWIFFYNLSKENRKEEGNSRFQRIQSPLYQESSLPRRLRSRMSESAPLERSVVYKNTYLLAEETIQQFTTENISSNDSRDRLPNRRSSYGRIRKRPRVE